MTVSSEPAPGSSHGARIVVVGASAGGVEALVRLIATLPADLPWPVLVVLHVSPSGTSALPSILARASRLPVSAARDGDELRDGAVYVAPPDHHLIVDNGRLRLTQSPRENGHRPAIDATMRSAAGAYHEGAIGIVLSGARDDGTAGLLAIKAGGGLAVAQDPDEALYDGMPRSAIRNVELDAVLALEDMGDWVLRQASARSRSESERPMAGSSDDQTIQAPGTGTRFTCPDCGGVLFETRLRSLERFECSVGHAYSIDSLSSVQSEVLENALWAAVRSLEDRAAMLDRLALRARGGQQDRSARTFERQARQARDRAATIRQAIQPPSANAPAAAAAGA